MTCAECKPVFAGGNDTQWSRDKFIGIEPCPRHALTERLVAALRHYSQGGPLCKCPNCELLREYDQLEGK